MFSDQGRGVTSGHLTPWGQESRVFDVIYVTGVRTRDKCVDVTSITHLRWVDPDSRQVDIVEVEDIIARIRSGLLVRIHSPDYGDPEVTVDTTDAVESIKTVTDLGGQDLLVKLAKV